MRLQGWHRRRSLGGYRPLLEALEERAVPAIAVTDVAVVEGDAGTVAAVFSVSTSGLIMPTISVDFQTTDGTATAGADYQPASGVLVFSDPATTVQTITVQVIGDTLDEPDETFTLNLSNANGDTIADGQGLGSIANDDAIPVTPPSGTGVPICAVEGRPLNNVPVATFEPGQFSDVPFTAVINWGDGTPPSPGTVVASGPGFAVLGSHTYTTEGNYPVSVSVQVNRQEVLRVNSAAPVFGYITSLYNNVLDRAPEPGGLEFWVGRLRAGLSRQQIANVFWASAEHRGLEVDQLYTQLLGRPADPGGRAFYVNLLTGGGSPATVVLALLTSAEYTAAHPDNTSYVSGLYTDLLERPGGADAASWVQALQAGRLSRSEVAFFFLTSDEAFVRAINDYYQEFLGRSADAAAQQALIVLARTGQLTPLTLSALVLGSDEYLGIELAQACPPAGVELPPGPAL